MQRRGWPPKHAPPHLLPYVSRSDCVGISRGSQNFGALGPPWDRAWLTPLHLEIGRVMSKGELISLLLLVWFVFLVYLPCEVTSLLSVCDRYAKYVLAGLISGTGPGTNPGGEAKLCQANSGTYSIGLTIYSGQSSVTKQYKFGTSASWEGVALAMRHRQ